MPRDWQQPGTLTIPIGVNVHGETILKPLDEMPHLLAPVLYDERQVETTLAWLVDEMEVRYQRLEHVGVRHINEYNATVTDKLHKIVLVIDEYADLMLQKPKGMEATAETAIIRLAQKARAVGIHVVLGTQRPSVDVVTGLIKANMPTRIAFMTSSRVDSQVILDRPGAEELRS